MIRVEAGANATFDETNKEEAFRRALHLLNEGASEVKVWIWGPSNTPLELTKDNFQDLQRVHVYEKGIN